MNREDIIDGVEYLAFDECFMKGIQYKLRDAVNALDVELVSVLVKIRADPNINPDFQYKDRNFGFIHGLSLRYEPERTLRGSSIIEVLNVLLKMGANPNQAGDCNMAPIQRCTNKTMKPVKDLLIKFGANIEGNVLY